MSTYPGWRAAETTDEMRRDMLAGLAALMAAALDPPPRKAVMTYSQAVLMLRLWPTRRNRRRLVRLTLSMRRILRRRPHPARLARRRIEIRFGFFFGNPPDA